ncbi:MAG: penicillin-binding protein 2 [Candidatus Rokubacteria bacterium 13_1_20CM_2_68_19]|nr:MAG: penicillin-binding protein 2 [Candidatus Rokubacteria bacterium 13_2_20CM_2_64_8]OLE45577.1 MAG: penicillin-binding protein 2 [Candidatus Rokubacteria bacterium 13_1_20CM_2_68_19]PYN65590.1 MAG: penicillin-binding protein 2 [Candidatus Rokubacteria bacterium]
MSYRAPLAERRDRGKARIMAIAVAVMGAFLVIVGQLWYLQVLEGGHFLDASDKNRIRIRPVAAPRGILFDKNGVPLVDNRPAFTLSLIPRELPREDQNRDAVLGRVASLLQIPYQELAESVTRVPSDSFLPVRVRRGLTLEDMAKIEEWKLELPGVIVEVEPQRTYPNSRFAAHLLGYVREASDEQLKGGRYRRGDMVGQSGLERLLDEFLRGRDGGERIEVDALGRPVRVVQHTDPHPGSQVITTIDRRVQEAAEQAMEGKAGAIVVMDPRSGDIRALVSTPAFEIDRFTATIDRAAWLRVVQDPDHPLLNRAIQSQYAPGSIFKIVVTAAGLQEATIAPMDRVYCNGEFHLGAWTFKDWKEGGHGSVDLQKALAQSCNIFYYQAGLKIGGAAITKYARAFGFGTATGVELGGEKLGLIPQPKGRRKSWQGGDIVNMSIGQGQVLVTPLQVARFMAAVANGGVLWKPRLVERIERPDRGVLYSDPGQVAGHVELSPAVWAFLRQALWAVVNDGTGIAAKIPGIDIAGKTGTAQMIAHSKAEKGQDHAWFAAFAPVRDPEVVVVVLVERGGKGGQVAAPIARRILNAIFFEKVAVAEIRG